jgi:hypothetical protein
MIGRILTRLGLRPADFGSDFGIVFGFASGTGFAVVFLENLEL